MARKYADAAKLTDSQKEEIRKEFREWSGGYHPGEAGEEHDRFLEEWESVYGHDALDAFLTQWGEEELEKEAEASKKREAEKKEALKKRLHEIAKSCVSIDKERSQVTVKVDDVTLYLPVRRTTTEAKAEWADCVWALETMLRRGAEEAAK